jgi:hypothetical protein
MTASETAVHGMTERTGPDSLGCYKVGCLCGWDSAPTDRPQHLGRAYRSHRECERKQEERRTARRGSA